MDLKSYSTTEAHKKTPEGEHNGPREEDVRRAIKHFSGMSNDQLMRELSWHLARQRANGKSEEVKRTIERIRPLLSVDQRKRLEEILEKVE